MKKSIRFTKHFFRASKLIKFRADRSEHMGTGEAREVNYMCKFITNIVMGKKRLSMSIYIYPNLYLSI